MLYVNMYYLLYMMLDVTIVIYLYYGIEPAKLDSETSPFHNNGFLPSKLLQSNSSRSCTIILYFLSFFSRLTTLKGQVGFCPFVIQYYLIINFHFIW